MSVPTLEARYQVAPSAPGAALVTRDGFPAVVTDRPEAYLHAATPSSVDWATTHEGWAIRTAPTPNPYPMGFAADLRGAAAFVTIAGRRGYGASGRAVRLCLAVAELAADLQTTPDYVAVSDVLVPLCTAAIGSLSWVDGDLECIRSMLDGAIRDAAVRGGLDRDAADAL